MRVIAEQANVDRAGLYRSLSGEMDPAFDRCGFCEPFRKGTELCVELGVMSN
jgi:hypothetical protein